MKSSAVTAATLALMALSLPTLAADEKKEDQKKPQSLSGQVSYMMGHEWGFQQQGFPLEIDMEMLIRGIKDGLKGDPPIFSQEEAAGIFEAFQKKAEQEAREQREKNQLEALRFFEGNKRQEGVVQTKSGLQYKTLRNGAGAKPKMGERVKVHFRGTALDGTEIDSSYDGEPFVGELKPVQRGAGLIEGWIEGLQLMPVGSKFRFWVPSRLAYGAKPPQGSPIQPESALIYDIELLEILPPEPEAATPAAGVPEKK